MTDPAKAAPMREDVTREGGDRGMVDQKVIDRLTRFSKSPENWRFIYDLAVSPDPAGHIARDIAVLLTVMREGVDRGTVERGWSLIDTCPMWQVAIVTDGENVAKAQKAEADYGGFYFAADPDDCLEWEPTHWIEEPAALDTEQPR